MIKRFLWIVLLAFGLQAAWAFSLGGPIGNNPNPIDSRCVQGDAWQAQSSVMACPAISMAPKNLGEEYRRNMPVMYYAFDANFLDFFGSNGVVGGGQRLRHLEQP